MTTAAPGLRAPATIGDDLIPRILRDRGGTAVAVTDDKMRAARQAVARAAGLYVSLESAATYAAAERLAARGLLRADERVVALTTAAGAKQPDAPEGPLPLPIPATWRSTNSLTSTAYGAATAMGQPDATTSWSPHKSQA